MCCRYYPAFADQHTRAQREGISSNLQTKEVTTVPESRHDKKELLQASDLSEKRLSLFGPIVVLVPLW